MDNLSRGQMSRTVDEQWASASLGRLDYQRIGAVTPERGDGPVDVAVQDRLVHVRTRPNGGSSPLQCWDRWQVLCLWFASRNLTSPEGSPKVDGKGQRLLVIPWDEERAAFDESQAEGGH